MEKEDKLKSVATIYSASIMKRFRDLKNKPLEYDKTKIQPSVNLELSHLKDRECYQSDNP